MAPLAVDSSRKAEGGPADRGILPPMMRIARPGVALPCLVSWGCGESSPPGDVVVAEGPASATVERSPFDARFELPDGTSWGAPESEVPELGLLSFGAYTSRMNPNRYYDPVEAVPGMWIRPGRVRSATVDGAHAVLDVEIDPLVGAGLDVELTRSCDLPPGDVTPYRCSTTVRVAVREPANVAFTRLAWALEPGEALYGLGERFDEPDGRGRVHTLQMALANTESNLNEIHVPVPWVVSTRGYAVLVEDTRPAGFVLGATRPDVATATFASVGFTFHVVTSPDLCPVRGITASDGSGAHAAGVGVRPADVAQRAGERGGAAGGRGGHPRQ